MLTQNQRVFKQEAVEAIQDLNKVPKHLQLKWWRGGIILFGEADAPIWPVSRPQGLPFNIIVTLYREFVFWTYPPVGIYRPEKLGTVNIDYPSEYDS